jgi:hypothetical protein
MKKFITLMLLATLCCASAFAARGVIASDSADNYTAATFVNGANLGTGFKPWEFWNAPPTLADCTDGWAIGNINSANGVAFRFARDGIDGDPHWGYCNGYRGFDALNVGDILTFKFACAYCAGGRGLDLFGNNGHRVDDDHPENDDKIGNVIHLSGDNIYSVNGNTVSTDWAPNAVSEVTVEQLENDIIKLTVKRTKSDGTVDVNYTTNIPSSKGPVTGIGLYAGGWEWKNGEDVENYAFYVNDLQIEGEVPEGGALTLVEDTGDWLVNTPEPTTFNYTVSIPEAVADDVQVQLGIAGSFGELSARSVTIPAGETSADFTVTAQVNGSGNYAQVTVSAENYSSAHEQIYGPSVSWSKSVHTSKEEEWQLAAGDTVDFWINNNTDTGTPANEYITATTGGSEILSCSALAEWADADPDPGTYTSGTLTASEPAAETQVTFQIKFGDVVFHEYNFTVYPAPAPLSVAWPDSLTVGDTVTVTVTANGLDGHTLLVSADDGGTYATLGGDIDSEGYLYPTGDSWTGSFTIEATAVSGDAILFKVEDVDDDAIVSSVELAISAFVPTLSLEPVGGWTITDPDTTVTFTVTCDPAPATALTLDVSAATPDWANPFEIVLPAADSVVIAAGETSTTFEVALKTTALNDAVDITVSDPLDGGYQASTYGVKGPYADGVFRWSMAVTHTGTMVEDWELQPGDTVQFWINNDSADFRGCNDFVTAGVTAAGLTCSDLDPWGEAGDVEGGTYTSGLLTAVDAGEHVLVPFQIKYGDVVIAEYGFNVYGTAGGEAVEIPMDSLSFSGDGFSFTVPNGYTVAKVEYATELENGNWKFDNTTTFQVNIGVATVDLPDVDNAVFRVTFDK